MLTVIPLQTYLHTQTLRLEGIWFWFLQEIFLKSYFLLKNSHSNLWSLCYAWNFVGWQNPIKGTVYVVVHFPHFILIQKHFVKFWVWFFFCTFNCNAQQNEHHSSHNRKRFTSFDLVNSEQLRKKKCDIMDQRHLSRGFFSRGTQRIFGFVCCQVKTLAVDDQNNGSTEMDFAFSYEQRSKKGKQVVIEMGHWPQE